MPPAYEVLLLNTAIPQIQAAQSGDTYVVPRDIAFSAALTLSAGTANGVPYLNGSKVVTTGSALTFDGTNFGTTGNANLGSGSKSTDTQLNFASDLGTQSIYLDRGTRSLVFYDATTGIENYRIAGITGIQTWGVGGSEQMRLTSTGLGIGTSSPAYKLQVGKTDGTANVETAIFSGASYGVQTIYGLVGTNTFVVGNNNSGSAHNGLPTGTAGMWMGQAYPLVFGTSGTERARITSGGYFKASNSGTYVNSTSTYHELYSNASGDWIAYFTQATATNPNGVVIQYTAAAPNGTGSTFLYCQDNAAVRATIRSNGGLANYQSNNVDLSDIRTKTDINPLGSYWNKIAGLEIVTYKYRDQTHDDPNIGVIAQQVEQVAPEFVDVDGFGDTPEDGVPLKTIYNKDLTFAAIKALQEAMTRIEQLEAEVAALKGA